MGEGRRGERVGGAWRARNAEEREGTMRPRQNEAGGRDDTKGSLRVSGVALRGDSRPKARGRHSFIGRSLTTGEERRARARGSLLALETGVGWRNGASILNCQPLRTPVLAAPADPHAMSTSSLPSPPSHRSAMASTGDRIHTPLISLNTRNEYCQRGTWCSGITSASHAEGPGFKSQCVHFTVARQSPCKCGAGEGWRRRCYGVR